MPEASGTPKSAENAIGVVLGARQAEEVGEELLQLAFTALQDVREVRHEHGESPALQSAEACLAAQITLTQESLAELRDQIERMNQTPFAPVPPSLSKTWLVIDETGTIVGASDDACAVLQHERPELVGTPLADHTGADPAAVQTAIATAFESGRAEIRGHIEVLAVDVRFNLQRVPDLHPGQRRVVVDALPLDQPYWTSNNSHL